MGNSFFNSSPIEGHLYPESIVSLSAEIYCRTHCGFRSVASLLTYLNEFFNLGLSRIPCHNTIENWILKAGYQVYQAPVESSFSDSFAQIIDESILLGDQKVLLSLGTNAHKTSDKALSRNDVRVLDISVAPRWNGQSITKVLKQTEKKIGKAPQYIVSDNDSKLNKAIRDGGYVQIRDVGHTIALLLAQIYKHEPDFKEFTKTIANLKRYAVLGSAYPLLPPRQRSISRFMNISQTINWATKIDNAYYSLNPVEQKTFSFIKDHQDMIREFDCIFNYINPFLELIKHRGLSRRLINKQLKQIAKKINLNTPRVKCFKKAMENYLIQEKQKIKKKKVYNASSDIIETLFGSYKIRKSPNSLHGVTPFVLILPLLTQMPEGKERSKIDFKQALESVKMKDLAKWREEQLPENQMLIRRRKMAG